MKNISKKIVLLILAIASIFTIAICSGCGSSEPEFEGWYKPYNAENIASSYMKIKKVGELYDVHSYSFDSKSNSISTDSSETFIANYNKETKCLENEIKTKKITYDSKEDKYYCCISKNVGEFKKVTDQKEIDLVEVALKNK